eukprot:241908-Amorphochlora_amoeboformis.AAC.1
MIDAEGLDVLQDVLQDPQHRDEPDEIETVPIPRDPSLPLPRPLALSLSLSLFISSSSSEIH